MSTIRDMLDLLERGFRHYSGHVPEEYYTVRRCRTPQKAEWFSRPWSEEHKQTRYVCLGCSRRCWAIDPVGWQMLLPVGDSRPGAVVFAPMMPLTADDLLRMRRVLRVDEACFVLNIGRTTFYEWTQDGRLDVVPGTPIRVTVQSVCRNLEPE